MINKKISDAKNSMPPKTSTPGLLNSKAVAKDSGVKRNQIIPHIFCVIIGLDHQHMVHQTNDTLYTDSTHIFYDKLGPMS